MRLTALLVLISGLAIGTGQENTKPTPVVWNPKDGRCKVIYSDGVPHEQFILGTILIDMFQPDAYNKQTDKLMVGIVNTGTTDLDVDPQRWAAQADDPKHTLMQLADADKLLAKDESHQRRMQAVGAALSGFGAGMQTQTATVSNSDGSTSTVTYRDPSATQRANESASQAAVTRTNYYAKQSTSVLRRNTVSSGKFVVGFVYFEKPKGLDKHTNVGAVAINLNDIVYIFPFDKGKIPIH